MPGYPIKTAVHRPLVLNIQIHGEVLGRQNDTLKYPKTPFQLVFWMFRVWSNWKSFPQSGGKYMCFQTTNLDDLENESPSKKIQKYF